MFTKIQNYLRKKIEEIEIIQEKETESFNEALHDETVNFEEYYQNWDYNQYSRKVIEVKKVIWDFFLTIVDVFEVISVKIVLANKAEKEEAKSSNLASATDSENIDCFSYISFSETNIAAINNAAKKQHQNSNKLTALKV